MNTEMLLEDIRKIMVKYGYQCRDMADEIVQAALNSQAKSVPDKTVKRMVDAFLGWPLPDDFAPDCGISFTNKINEGTEIEHQYKPIGTNLFTADQAKAMVEYMLSAAPQPSLSTEADKVRDLEAKILDLPRYSFLSPKEGGVRRCGDKSGAWIERYEVIKLLEAMKGE